MEIITESNMYLVLICIIVQEDTYIWMIYIRLQLPSNSNIIRTKSQTFNISRLGLQLSLSNPLKAGVK